MARSTVDLPDPDSPTMPKVSPGATSNEMSLHGMDVPSAAVERHAQVLDGDHCSHAGSRTTVASSARGASSDGVAATSALV